MSRISRLLNTDVEIWRATLTDDGGGGQIETWALLSSPRARLSQPNAQERSAYRADQEATQLSHVVYMEPGTDIRANDEVHTVELTLSVAAVFQPSMPGTYLRVDCTTHQRRA